MLRSPISLGLCILFSSMANAAVSAQFATEQAIQSIQVNSSNPVSVTRDSSNGFVKFISADPKQPIQDYSLYVGAEERARAYLGLNQNAFVDLATGLDLVTTRVVETDDLGMSHVRLKQQVNGIPVRGAEVTVHMNSAGVTAVSSNLIPGLINLDTHPALPGDAVLDVAKQAIMRTYGPVQAYYTAPQLEIVDLADFNSGDSDLHLAWLIHASGSMKAEQIWIDAHSGELLFQLNQIMEVKERETRDLNYENFYFNGVLRTESQLPTGNFEVDRGHYAAGITYDYFFNNFSRDSFNNTGGTIVTNVNYCRYFTCQPTTAFFDGNNRQMFFSPGYTLTDVVAHEFTHGITFTTSGLDYFKVQGALNESFSDVFGQTIDLKTEDDGPQYRWRMGEELVDHPTGVRDMMDPTLFNHPAKVTQSTFTCLDETQKPDDSNDYGWVHTNSGVPNHAYALLVDGGTYNGYTITGIGLDKAAAINYRALDVYTQQTTDFVENFDHLVQSCADLIGTSQISFNDCAEVKNAGLAVEMGTQACPKGSEAPPPKPPVSLDPLPTLTPMCTDGQTADFTFQDDFENINSGNWVSQSSTVNHWSNGIGDQNLYSSDKPNSGAYSLRAAGVGSAGTSSVALTKDVTLPENAFLQFTSNVDLESGYDGGVVEYSTDGGQAWMDAEGLFESGKNYNGGLTPGLNNPLEGRPAFTASSGGYTTTKLDLSSLAGQNVRFRFTAATDKSVASNAWFVDDVAIFTCSLQENTPPKALSGGVTTQANTLVRRNLVAYDDDGDQLTYSIVSNGLLGTAVITNPAASEFTYTPNSDVTGTDSFTYKVNDGQVDSNVATITVTINAVNQVPVANDGALIVEQDTPTTGSLTATDADGDGLTYSIVTNGSKGTVVITNASTGAYTYTPNTDATGTDSFTFKVNDEQADSNTATVSITIATANIAPVANDASITTDEDNAISGNLSATDANGDELVFSIVSNGSLGTAAITNAKTGAFTYTPGNNANSTDTFSFKVNDSALDSNVATITVTVNPVNDVPTVSPANLSTNVGTPVTATLSATDVEGDDITFRIASDPGNGTVELNDAVTGSITYTPDSGFTGQDSFTYVANDGTADSAPATISVTVSADDGNGTLPVADITISTTDLTVSESGDEAQFTIVLNSAPTDKVTIPVMSSDPSEGKLNQSMITFDNSNWNVPQTIKVTGVDDDFTDGDIKFSVIIDSATSNDTAYDGIDPDDISVTNLDNDQADIIISKPSGLETSESGRSTTFTVVLNNQPTADVNIELSSSDLTEGRVVPAKLTFTRNNWDIPREVTIKGVDDLERDGNVSYTVIIGKATSNDLLFNGIDPEDIEIVNKDNENAGVGSFGWWMLLVGIVVIIGRRGKPHPRMMQA